PPPPPPPAPPPPVLMTTVSTEAQSLDGSGSEAAPETHALLVSVPAVLASTATWMVAVSPGAMDPRSQVTVLPAWVQVPWEGIACRNVVPAGRLSVTTTSPSVSGPL